MPTIYKEKVAIAKLQWVDYICATISPAQRTIVKDWLKKIKFNEEKISRVLGILIVILTGLLLVNYFKSVNRVGTTGDASQISIEEDVKPATPEMTVSEVAKQGLPAEYTVKKGDSLWSIAAVAYSDGYKWGDVYAANKSEISNPNMLKVGQKITLPKLEAKTADVIEHKVVKGETLSGIAFNVCGNAYMWPAIAEDNKIVNPRLIEPGLVLKVTCRLN